MNWRKSTFSFSNGNCLEAASWRKSGHSESGNCTEVAAWRKSAHSEGSNCTEAGHGQGVVGVRDSKLGEASPVLEFTPLAWQAFTRRLRES